MLQRLGGHLAGRKALIVVCGRPTHLGRPPQEPAKAVRLQGFVGPGVGLGPKRLQTGPQGLRTGVLVLAWLEGGGEDIEVAGLVQFPRQPFQRGLGPLLRGARRRTEHRERRAPAAECDADLVKRLGRARAPQPGLVLLDLLHTGASDLLQRLAGADPAAQLRKARSRR